MKATVTRRRCP